MTNSEASVLERHILVVKDGRRRAIALDAAAYSIGRDPSSAIVLESDSVSRQHAMLLRLPLPGTKAYQYRLIDGNSQGRASANGVFVNGSRCRSHDLKNGDVVRFGNSVEGSYLAVSMGEEEFHNYLESITYQSIKSASLIAKETLVVNTAGSDEETPSGMLVQQRADAPRERPSHLVETVFDQARPTPHPFRLWMAIVPLAIVGIGAIAAAGLWMSRQQPAPSSVEQSSPEVETVADR